MDHPVFFLGTLFAFQFVIFHAIRVSGNQDYSGMMDQAVKNGRCPHTVLKDISHLEMGILVVKMVECTLCLSRISWKMRLIGKVDIHMGKFTLEFKSGVSIEIEG